MKKTCISVRPKCVYKDDYSPPKLVFSSSLTHSAINSDLKSTLQHSLSRQSLLTNLQHEVHRLRSCSPRRRHWRSPPPPPPPPPAPKNNNNNNQQNQCGNGQSLYCCTSAGNNADVECVSFTNGGLGGVCIGIQMCCNNNVSTLTSQTWMRLANLDVERQPGLQL